MRLEGACWRPAGGAARAWGARKGWLPGPPPPQGRQRRTAANGVGRYIKSVERHKSAGHCGALYGSSKYSSGKYTVLGRGCRGAAAGHSPHQHTWPGRTPPAGNRTERQAQPAAAIRACLPPRRKQVNSGRQAGGGCPSCRVSGSRGASKLPPAGRPAAKLQLTPSCLRQGQRGACADQQLERSASQAAWRYVCAWRVCSGSQLARRQGACRQANSACPASSTRLPCSPLEPLQTQPSRAAARSPHLHTPLPHSLMPRYMLNRPGTCRGARIEATNRVLVHAQHQPGQCAATGKLEGSRPLPAHAREQQHPSARPSTPRRSRGSHTAGQLSSSPASRWRPGTCPGGCTCTPARHQLHKGW